MLAISGARPARFFLSPVLFPFARHVFGSLVLAKSEINGMTHLARARPFGEFYFRDEPGLDPGGDGFVFHLFAER